MEKNGTKYEAELKSDSYNRMKCHVNGSSNTHSCWSPSDHLLSRRYQSRQPSMSALITKNESQVPSKHHSLLDEKLKVHA